MNHSPSIAAIAAALAKAQGEMTHAVKDSVNPHFKNRYADLASVLDAVRGPLSKHGLSVTQLATTSEHGAGVTTLLMHASGEWISQEFVLPVSKNDAQGVGSTLTYARRYALAAICGIAQDDDDGEAAAAAKPRAPARVAVPEPRTREQVEAIEAAFGVLGMPEAEWGPFAKKAAGTLDPRSMAGAAAVLDALDKLITERGAR